MKWAEHAPEKDRRSFRAEDFVCLATEGQLHLLDGPSELFEGFDLVLSEGHTVGMQLPLIDGGEAGKLYYCADLIPTRAHIQLPWIMAFDLYPLTTLEEKRLLLAQALDDGWTLFFEHDPQVAACKLAEAGGKVVAGEPVVL
jgi:glyoxylase-like metal-dependent hydrolase (beta-lactamase superfamily II)